ncbi:SPOSA6832_00629 [Sporobolomyces salmonicolor]|uniref:SPOSA6832_00629-mRNA-1:cds n=1 Tax=Sporidiobolus salmonicolor TaxID=5005 RepID=A0A0D6EHA4_SPOSA|nr:SPOSA6832_00629 [Sporobolomyces salmonicolor]
MATAERPYTFPAEQPVASTSSFDPSAVPTQPPATSLYAPSPFAGALGALQREEDLIDLGEEQLFSGSRSRGARPPAGQDGALTATAVEAGGEEHIGSTSAEELLGSLGAARQAFVFALNSLLQQYMSGSGQASSSLVNDAETASSSTLFTNPIVDPAALLAPFRRHSLATITPSIPRAPATPSLQSSDLLLTTLLDNLRSHMDRQLRPSGSPAMISIERSSPLLGGLGSTSSSQCSGTQILLDELQSRIEVIAPDLPPMDAELARSLGSLLSCTERLASMARSSGSLSASAERTAEPDSPDLYLTLEREAAVCRSSRDQRAAANSVVGAVQEVEQAERELLWGRVDDLSERVRLLSRQRAEALREEEAGALTPDFNEKNDAEPWTPRARDVAFDVVSLSDLPTYSHDHDPAHHPAHLPPAYYTDFSALDEKERSDWDVKPPLSPSVDQHASSSSSAGPMTRPRKISSVNTEKMQRDLDSVSQAIERLYLVSPQLANQRVEPDRPLLRERQLAKLGNAIERLSQGRFEDQRAIPSPLVDAPESQIERRQKDQAMLDRLIDQIDRAASRTLTDQRVELKRVYLGYLALTQANTDDAFLQRQAPGDPECRHVQSEPLTFVSPQYEPLSDPREAKRREFILEHTGKGRLASQDAVLHSSGPIEPFPGPPSELNKVINIAEFFSNEVNRPRSNSAPTNAVKKKFSSRNLFQSKVEDDGSGPAGKMASLRIGVFKKNGSRRGSHDANAAMGLGVLGPGMPQSASANGLEVLTVPQFDWITEESRNLGTLVVTFWLRAPSSSSRDEEYDVVAVETEAILVASSRGGPASRLSLPCRVVPQQANVTSQGPYHEVKLIIINPSQTMNRADLEVHVPLSTSELRETMPVSFVCATCDAELIDTSTITRYNALPSEHWAELLDAWMCHQDQTLSDDLIQKGKGIKPRLDEGLVGTSYVLFPREVTRNWHTPEQSLSFSCEGYIGGNSLNHAMLVSRMLTLSHMRQSTRSPNDDLLHPAHCTSCSSLIGAHVTSLDPSSSPFLTALRLLKYAANPIVKPPPDSLAAERSVPLRYSLSSHLTAEMLETGQAHACHRFVLEDAEQEKIRLLVSDAVCPSFFRTRFGTDLPRLQIWFFNPAVRLSFCSSSALASILELAQGGSSPSAPPSASHTSADSSSPVQAVSSEGKLVGRSMNVVKVFYAVVLDENDRRWQIPLSIAALLPLRDFLENKTERMTYPRAVIDRLVKVLQASTLVYPPAKRKFGDLEVGFLERI